jgi:predicted transport protein
MGDIKFFSLAGEAPHEILGQNVAVERSLQRLIESHLDVFFAMRFLATEYSTGAVHGGRVDTLALDENGSPVIIEYKRATNENVINQGLYYMTWLVDHKAEFEALVRKMLGNEAVESVAWSAPRLICIAGDYTKFDMAAIQQIDRTIDLVRYKMYGSPHLILELLATTQRQIVRTAGPGGQPPRVQQVALEVTYADQLARMPQDLRDLYEALRAFLLALGDDVQETSLAHYIGFRRIKNFACVVIHPQQHNVVARVKVNPDTIQLEQGFTRDIRNIGHRGTGDLEITLHTAEDLQRAEPLLRQSYEAS